MKNIVKKISVGGWIVCLGAVLGLVAMIIALVSCSNEGFFIAQLPLIIVFTVLACLLLLGSLAFAGLRGDNWISSIGVVGGAVLLMLALFDLVAGKEDVLGTVLFSDLEKGFAPAEFACYVGVVAMAFYAVSILVIAIGSFLRLSRKEKGVEVGGTAA